MAIVGSGKNKDIIDRNTENTIKQIAYEHGMSLADARIFFNRTRDD